jgi:hypothetical protein
MIMLVLVSRLVLSDPGPPAAAPGRGRGAKKIGVPLKENDFRLKKSRCNFSTQLPSSVHPAAGVQGLRPAARIMIAAELSLTPRAESATALLCVISIGFKLASAAASVFTISMAARALSRGHSALRLEHFSLLRGDDAQCPMLLLRVALALQWTSG